jgi:hypothetical protein
MLIYVTKKAKLRWEGTWNLTAPTDSYAGQKRDQQRAKRRLAGDAPAQRHAGFSTLSIASPMRWMAEVPISTTSVNNSDA